MALWMLTIGGKQRGAVDRRSPPSQENEVVYCAEWCKAERLIPHLEKSMIDFEGRYEGVVTYMIKHKKDKSLKALYRHTSYCVCFHKKT